MPADRLIHPRCGHSVKVTGLSDLEFRVWIQYLLSADDFGVLRASALTLQADNASLERRGHKAVQKAIDRLVSVSLVHAFDHQGRRYLYQRDWQAWQKVSYPRATDDPPPTADALAACDESTRDLFRLHPGGKGRKFPKRSENVPETFPESSRNVSEKSPTTRAGAPADRLTANASGERDRLTANGARPLDKAFLEFQEAYPENRRKGGFIVQQSYVEECDKAGGPEMLMEALRNHNASEQWQTPKLIPGMDTWLTEERWRQRFSPAKPVGVGSTSRTAGNVDALRRFATRKVAND